MTKKIFAKHKEPLAWAKLLGAFVGLWLCIAVMDLLFFEKLFVLLAGKSIQISHFIPLLSSFLMVAIVFAFSMFVWSFLKIHFLIVFLSVFSVMWSWHLMNGLLYYFYNRLLAPTRLSHFVEGFWRIRWGLGIEYGSIILGLFGMMGLAYISLLNSKLKRPHLWGGVIWGFIALILFGSLIQVILQTTPCSTHQIIMSWQKEYLPYVFKGRFSAKSIYSEESLRQSYTLRFDVKAENKPVDEMEKSRFANFLGLPDQTLPKQLLFIYVPNWSAFEVNHPQMGSVVFPQLRSILSKKSVYAKQVYSSAYGYDLVGSVRRQVMCSDLKSQYTQGRCFSDLLKNQGYKWLNDDVSPDQLMGWLANSLNKLDFSRPFGVELSLNNVMNLTPASDIDLESMNPLIQELSSRHQIYENYLRKMNTLDRRLGLFLNTILKNERYKDMLVVLMGTHTELPNDVYPKSNYSAIERSFRVPVAFIGASIEKPKLITFPISFVDIAPTLALLGRMNTPVQWYGQPIFSSNYQFTWLSLDPIFKHQRNSQTTCYTTQSQVSKCFLTNKHTDPLFEELKETPKASSSLKKIEMIQRQLIQQTY